MLAAAPVQAATVIYTISGTGSGVLEGAAFNSAAFTFTLTGDTSTITGAPGVMQFSPLSSAEFVISGAGSGTFNVQTYLGQNGNIIFFSQPGHGDLFDFYGPVIDLSTSFGPEAGINVFGLNQFQSVSTTAGALTFNASSNVVFSGQLIDTANAVPEPASWAMMITGFGAIGFAMRRRREQQPKAHFAV